MRKLLFESRGKLTKRAIALIIFAILMFVFAGALFLRSSEIGGYHLSIGSGLFGSSLSVRNEKREAEIFALILLFVGAFLADLAIGESRCWVRVYNDHVEGRPIHLGLRQVTFSLPIQEISSVFMDEQKVRVVFQTKGTAYKVSCAEYRKVFHLVDQLISGSTQKTTASVRQCVACRCVLSENALFCPNCGTRNEV